MTNEELRALEAAIRRFLASGRRADMPTVDPYRVLALIAETLDRRRQDLRNYVASITGD